MPDNCAPEAEMPAAKLPTFMTVDEAAETLRCSTKTIYRRIKAGELQSFKDGGHYLIDVEVVRAKLIKNMVRAKPKSPNPLSRIHLGVSEEHTPSRIPSTE